MGEPRSDPPEIPGFTYVRGLGGGGFADVFLYHQRRPAREVAVKVLRAGELPADLTTSFDREADLMASVSGHPYIVTIFQADQAADGRPFLVMEYYPKPNFAQRAKVGLDAPAALRLGVQLAGAVETAHRAGVVHRDIKPANVLMSALDTPGLTDFGIAGSRADTTLEESVGMSIPYTAPEVIDRSHTGDELSDVYSLAATLYTLLARRSPFEVKGEPNSAMQLASRVLRGGPPPTGAAIPESLEHILASGLSRVREHRPQSARDLGLRLQSIEAELGYRRTDLVISSLSTPAWDRPDDDDGTRAAPLRLVDPDGPPRHEAIASPEATNVAATDDIDHSILTGTVLRGDRRPSRDMVAPPRPSPPGRDATEAPPTFAPPRVPDASPPPVRSRGGRRTRHPWRWRGRRVLAPSGAAVAGLVAATAIVLALRGTAADSGRPEATQDDVIEPAPGLLLGAPEVPDALELVDRGGQVFARWEGHDGDEVYVVVRYDRAGVVLDATTIEGTDAVLDTGPAGGLCVEVQAAVGTLRSAPTPRKCT